MNTKLNQRVVVAGGNTFLEPLDGFSHPSTVPVHYCDIVRCTDISAAERFLHPLERFPSIPADDFPFIEQEPKIVLRGCATVFGRPPKPLERFTR
jgi:hypothetical protein